MHAAILHKSWRNLVSFDGNQWVIIQPVHEPKFTDLDALYLFFNSVHPILSCPLCMCLRSGVTVAHNPHRIDYVGVFNVSISQPGFVATHIQCLCCVSPTRHLTSLRNILIACCWASCYDKLGRWTSCLGAKKLLRPSKHFVANHNRWRALIKVYVRKLLCVSEGFSVNWEISSGNIFVCFRRASRIG